MGPKVFPKSRAAYWALSIAPLFAAAVLAAGGVYVAEKTISALTADPAPKADVGATYIQAPRP